MRRFAALYRALDETTKTGRKTAALRDYFASATAADAVWAVYFLSGRRPKRLIKTAFLRKWCAEEAAIPEWLFDESYDAVGDLAETIALVLPEQHHPSDAPLFEWVEQRLTALAGLSEQEQRDAVLSAWRELSSGERLVFNKLVTGSFRVGVSQRLVVRALADVTGLTPAVIEHRLMGQWEATPEFYNSLHAVDTQDVDTSRPYPFCLAHPLQQDPETLGPVSEWMLEWKWDGIRAQVIRRGAESFIWSRGEELILERFPELAIPSSELPAGTVLDGEIVAWKDGRVMPFGELQRRIGRKQIGKKMLADVPAHFIAFDILEFGREDIRSRPYRERRAALEQLLSPLDPNGRIMLSPALKVESWEECKALRATSRSMNVEGLMLKHANSEYGVGRKTGLWWKWKIAPYTCDAVLIYAQRGSGRRASLYTDYTFGIWSNGELVPFAKAYSGLTDEEIREVDRFVRQNTLEKFGPVRVVKPELVFELAFESLRPSSRHKSGIAVRFPRMARWRHDKLPQDADTLESVKALASQRE